MTEVERKQATPPTYKGASPEAKMAPPNTPMGPNETEEGIIKSPPPEPPGTDQMGLVGGDPTESLQSTPPLEEVAPTRKEGRDSKQEARKEAR